MHTDEPIARTVARHRVIRTLLVYRAYLVMQALILLLACLKRGRVTPNFMVGLLGYDGMIAELVRQQGSDLPLYGNGAGIWPPFLLIFPVFISSACLLVWYNKHSHRRTSFMHATLRAIPLSLLIMSGVCWLLSLNGAEAWKVIAQIHTGPLVHRTIFISQANPTYPLLILLGIHLLTTLLLWRWKSSKDRWISGIQFNLVLLFAVSAVLIFLAVVFPYEWSRLRHTILADTGITSSTILLLLCLLWLTVHLSGSLFILPQGVSIKRVLSQAPHVGIGLYYPQRDQLPLFYFFVYFLQVNISFALVLLLCLLPSEEHMHREMISYVIIWSLFSVPTWIGLCIALGWYARRLRPIEEVNLQCPYCRYDLTGSLAADQWYCPECGEKIEGNHNKQHSQAQRKLERTQ